MSQTGTPPDASAARERLQCTGRNAPCPCGSGRKYKKCCRERDEQIVREAATTATAAVRVAPVALAGPPPRLVETEPPADDPVDTAVNQLWDEFDQLEHPTTAQMDAHLERLLALPAAATGWNDLLDAFNQRGHKDLPAVFRRITAVVPPAELGAFFHWNALEKFARHGRVDLIPEVVDAFCLLDGASYDADALKHAAYWAMAAGADEQALKLEEHFLPVQREDSNLMPYAVPDTCRTIFELRVGLRLRESDGPKGNSAALARELHRDVEEEIRADYVHRAARVICGEVQPGGVARDDFALVIDEDEKGEALAASLRQFEAVMHVAREAWQIDGRSPGWVFRALWLLSDAAYQESDDEAPKRASAPENLLDCLRPTGMERRIAKSTRGMLGPNEPHAHLLLEAHAVLLQFAKRHGLVDAALAAKSEANVAMLRKKLGFPIGAEIATR